MLQSVQEYTEKGCRSFGAWSQDMVPSSQTLTLRQARLARVTLMKCCWKRRRATSDRGQGRLGRHPRQRQSDVRALRGWKQEVERAKRWPHFPNLVFDIVPSSQISPLRQARFALVTLLKCCGNSSRTASGSWQGELPAGYTPEATTSKSSLGLTSASALECLPCSAKS